MNIYKPNKLGWVREINFEMGTGDALQFNLSGIAYGENQTALHNTLRGWMDDGIRGPSFEAEWHCLYCTSPNTINKTHCSQCGAPRNFILG